MRFINLHLHRHAIPLKTAQIELLPVKPPVTFNPKEVVVIYDVMPVVQFLKHHNVLCLHFVDPVTQNNATVYKNTEYIYRYIDITIF